LSVISGTEDITSAVVRSRADRERTMSVFGRLVGKWQTEIIYCPANQPIRRMIGEWEFGYALEGRAIIDVWQVPPRAEAQRTGVTAECGLCVRIYEPALDLWQFTFHGPVRGTTINMIAQSVDSKSSRNIMMATGSCAGFSLTSIATPLLGVRYAARMAVRPGVWSRP
jgi:hypothetical protein